jgi:hypothetical protein
MRDAQRNSQRERRMIRIMASVSGGVTGSRQSWLKSNGEIREFESLTEAKQVADCARDAGPPRDAGGDESEAHCGAAYS